MFSGGEKFFLWPLLILAAGIFFPFSIKAVGLSPPEAALGTVEAGETHMIYMRLQRETDEVGQIDFTVEAGGDQSENFVGDDDFVMQADENAYNYYFAFTPEEPDATDDYTLYVRFYYTVVGDSVSEPDAVGNSVERGVTGVVTFSMAGSVEEEDDDGGGGGGGGRPPRPDDDEDDDEDIEEDEEESPTSDTPPEGEGEEGEEVTEEDEDEGEEGTEGEDVVEPESEPEPEEDNPFDLDDDDDTDEEDVKEFFDCFMRGEGRCDFDDDDEWDARDLSLLASAWTGESDFNTGWSSFTVGPPLQDDIIVFRFAVAEQDAWRFHAILSGDSLSDDELISVYVLVDTGPDGVNAADLKFAYETTKFKFVGSDLLGTVFPIFLPEPQEIVPGVIKIMAASPAGFVGTNGLVARLDFEVLADGESNLSFIDLAAYEPGGIAPEQVQGIDFLGILEKEGSKFLAAPAVETPSEFSVKCAIWMELWARFYLWIIWLLLLLALITDIFAIIYYQNYYWKKKYDKKVSN